MRGYRYPLARWGNIKVMSGVGGNTRVMLGLYGDNGKENGNYYNGPWIRV